MNFLRRKVIPAQPERVEVTLDVVDEAGWCIRSTDGYLSTFMPDWLGANRRVFTPDDLRDAAARILVLAHKIEQEDLLCEN